MKKMFLTIIVTFLILPFTAFANSYADNYEIESWYAKIGTGISFVTYSDNLKLVEDLISERNPITKNFTFLSFYFTLNDNMLAGINLFDFESDSFENKDISVTRFNLTASYMYFTDFVNNGFFARFDAGLSKIVLAKENNTRNLYGYNWGDGYSVLLGGGYALPVSTGSSVLFELDYSMQSGKDSDDSKLTANSISFNINYIW